MKWKLIIVLMAVVFFCGGCENQKVTPLGKIVSVKQVSGSKGGFFGGEKIVIPIETENGVVIVLETIPKIPIGTTAYLIEDRSWGDKRYFFTWEGTTKRYFAGR